jgi:hypothetical protein
VLAKQRQDEARYGVLAKIRRDVADTQPAIRRRAIRVRAARCRQRRDVPVGPGAMLAIEVGRRAVGMVVQSKKKVAVELR